MTEQVPSKEVSLPELMRWLRHRHVVLVEQGAADTYEGYIHAHIESLQRTLRGIQSCSTCEACRGAATLALGGAAPEPRDVSAEFTRLRERESKVSGTYERAVVLRMDLEDLLQRAAQPPGAG